MKSYLVMGAYHSECCTSPHLWTKVVKATSKAKATAKIKRAMKRAQVDIGDLDAFELPIKIKEAT